MITNLDDASWKSPTSILQIVFEVLCTLISPDYTQEFFAGNAKNRAIYSTYVKAHFENSLKNSGRPLVLETVEDEIKVRALDEMSEMRESGFDFESIGKRELKDFKDKPFVQENYYTLGKGL